MSNLREAAQQALEALEHYRSGEDYQPTPASEAIAALRAALEQPEQIITPSELAAALGWPGGVSDPVLGKIELLQIAAEQCRLHDLADKFKWQVRDTCVRAEKAEAQRAALEQEEEQSPLDRMWARLAEHQPCADRGGYGEAWARMCQKRTTEAVDVAAWAAATEAAAAEVWAAEDAAAEAEAAAARAIRWIEMAEEER